MSISKTIRDSCGNKCFQCGYTEHTEILRIHHAERKRGKNENYTQYLYSLLEDLGNVKLLCPNCLAVSQATKSLVAPSKPLLLWKTSGNISLLEDGTHYGWADKAQNSGKEVWIIDIGGAVYSYPQYQKIADDWRVYFADRQLPSHLPEGVTEIES